MGAGNHPRTRKGRERGPRHGGKGHHGKRHDPHPGRAYHDGGNSAAPPPPNSPRLPGEHPPTHTAEASIRRRTDHPSAHPSATGNHTGNGGHTYTGRTGHTHRGSRRERRRMAHHHALTTRRRPRPPQGRPHRHRKRTKARPQRPGLGTETPRGHGTKAQAPREGNPTDRHAIDLPHPTARAACPSPHSTDPARHPHLIAPPSHQPATLRPALRTTTQARLTSTDPPRHNARPRHTAPQRATVQRATARRDATRHRAAQHDTTDPNLKDKPKPATAHPGRRRISTPHTSTAGHTRGHSAPGNNGGGPPRRLKPELQRGKDTNNPRPLTQSHKPPPGAAAQPAEPGPNPARRGAEPTVYIAHPTHGAGTRHNRTQLTTAAWKTTVNAGQCVRQPREGRGRNRQAPLPGKKKQQRGEGGGRENSPQPPNRPPTPPEAAKPPPPQKAPKTGPPKRHRGTTQRKPATPSQEQRATGKRDTETSRHTPRKKKSASSPARKKWDGGTGTTRPGTGTAGKKKKKAQKSHPDNPAKKGWAQPRPGPSTHAHTACRNQKRRGASGAPTQPHTSHKQAKTEPQPRTPQTAETRGTTPQIVRKHTHPRPRSGLAGLTKPTPNRQPDPNTNAAQQ